MRLLLICCLLICGLTAASAEDAQWTTEDFIKKCDSAFQSGGITTYNAGYCAAAVRAVIGLGPYLSGELKVCSQNKIIINGIAAMSQYVRKHPEKLKDDYLSVMIEAFQQEWPCK